MSDVATVEDALAAESVQVGGDDDTQPGLACLLCATRAQVDAAIVRARVQQITIVVTYKRPNDSRLATEHAKAMVCLTDDVIVKGEGHSREEAIVNALEHLGVEI